MTSKNQVTSNKSLVMTSDGNSESPATEMSTDVPDSDRSTLEVGVDSPQEVDEHDDEDDDSSSGAKVTSKSKRRKPGTQRPKTTSNDLLRAPFKEGWRREVVMRAMCDGEPTEGKKATADVYYFTPTGNKLRSLPDIEKYLEKTKSTLSMASFSFCRNPVYEEPHEVVRRATTKKGRPTSMSPKVKAKVKKVAKGKVGFLAATVASDESSSATSSPKKQSPGKRGRKAKVAKLAKGKKASKVASEAESLESENSVANLEEEGDGSMDAANEGQGDGECVAKSGGVGDEILPGKNGKEGEMVKDGLEERVDNGKELGRGEEKSGELSGGREGLTSGEVMKAGEEAKAAKGDEADETTRIEVDAQEVKGKVGEAPRVDGHEAKAAAKVMSSSSKAAKRSGDAKKRDDKAAKRRRNASADQDVSDTVEYSRTGENIVGPTSGCSPLCPGMEGTAPTRPCQYCLCLFHPECVGLSAKATAKKKSFSCKSCQLERGRDALSVNFSPVDDVTMTSSSLANVPPSIHVTTLTTTLTPVPPPPLLPAGQLLPIIHSLVPAPCQRLPPPLKPAPCSGTSASGVPQNVPLANHSEGGHGTPTVPPETSPQHGGGAFTGQLLTLPRSVLSFISIDAPLRLKVKDTSIVVPPENFVIAPNCVRVFLPSGTLPQSLVSPGQGKPLSLHVEKGNPDGHQTIRVRDVETTTKVSSVVAKDSGEKKKKERKRGEVVKVGEMAIGRLHGGFNALLRIFQFLPVSDLLRASTVCKTWRDLIDLPSLWKRVALKGHRVSNWAASRRKLQHAQSLDLTGLEFDSSPDAWHGFDTSLLGRLDSVRHLEFGSCPATILDAVVETLVQLQTLTVQNVFNDSGQDSASAPVVDMSKLAHLRELEVLVLRGGTSGLCLNWHDAPGVVNPGLPAKLKKLSLTSLRDTTENDYSRLLSGRQLEELELGDVKTWNDEMYCRLGKLKNLKRLRLENGGSVDGESIRKAFLALDKLERLELFRFAISEPLSRALVQMDGLRSLSLWPDTREKAALINSRTLETVTKMTFLQELEWGFFTKDFENDSIPFSKIVIPREGARGRAIGDLSPNVDVIELGKKLNEILVNAKINVVKSPNYP